MNQCTCGLPETWVKFPEKPGYEISDHGRVLSHAWGYPRLLKLVVNKHRNNYLQFSLGGASRNYKPHVEVMRLFFGPRPEGLDVRHLDGDVSNNHLSNLAYGTRLENMADAKRHGTIHNANKTHCPHGHEYTDENTWRSKNGGRYCRECARVAGRAWYAKQGAAQRKAKREKANAS